MQTQLGELNCAGKLAYGRSEVELAGNCDTGSKSRAQHAIKTGFFSELGDLHRVTQATGFGDFDIQNISSPGTDDGFGIVRAETTFVGFNRVVDDLPDFRHAGEVPRFAGLFEKFEIHFKLFGEPAEFDGFVGGVTPVGVGAEGNF